MVPRQVSIFIAMKLMNLDNTSEGCNDQQSTTLRKQHRGKLEIVYLLLFPRKRQSEAKSRRYPRTIDATKLEWQSRSLSCADP